MPACTLLSHPYARAEPAISEFEVLGSLLYTSIQLQRYPVLVKCCKRYC
jgi:hypothetical protein